jgi:uncharacterized membrane protein YgcG
MKKMISVLLTVVLLLSFGVSVSAYENTEKVMLFDGADFLSDAEEENLFDLMLSVSNAYDLNLEFITTAEDFTDEEIIAYAESNYDYDFGIDSNGSLFLIDSANGNWVDHFVLAGEVDDKVSDDQLDSIIKQVEQPIIDYDEHTAGIRWLLWLDTIYGGVVMDQINASIDEQYGDEPYEETIGDKISYFFWDIGYNLETFFDNIFNFSHINLDTLFAFGVLALIGGIVTFVVIWQRYKKHAKVSAVHYLDKNSVNIYNRSDRFVREFTTRTVHSDSSSSGGGGRSHGGGHHGGGGSRGRR